jgi:plasmid stabilization system protein ParE
VRRIVFDVDAHQTLSAQLDYLIAQHAHKAAHDLEARVRHFLVNHLARYPASGRQLSHRGLWEFPIPRTRLVVWYRFTDTELQVVQFWHGVQDRR